MKRTGIVVGIVVVLVALLVVWKLRGGKSNESKTVAAKPVSTKTQRVTETQIRPDPAKIAKASIEGTVIDEAKAPIANAQVCASGSSHELDPELLRDLICIAADARGKYKFENVLPAKYTVSASAKPFRPGVHYVGGDRKETRLVVAAGQQVTGIDITLRAGGVEITGVVSDLTGGTIEGARASVRSNRWEGTATNTQALTAKDGTFSLWVSPGPASIIASADGYADGWQWTRAPGKVEVLLTPESALSGTVVDAGSGEPVEGALVSVGGSDWSEGGTFTDAKGVFRVSRLTPGRYVAIARTDRGYGRSEGSTLVGLGQTIDGVVVKLHRAVRIDGKVVINNAKEPCKKPGVSFTDSTKARWSEVKTETDGRVWAEGVLPGKYTVQVACEGYQSKEKYEPIVVADKDITGLVWEVDTGAKVTGRVLSKAGAPIEGARVSASTVGGEARKKGGWASDQSLADGAYTLEGMQPGTYKVEVSTDKAVSPKDGWKIEVAAGSAQTKDLVLEDTGTIKGTVVDGEGKPVAGIRAHARNLTGIQWWSENENKTDENGTFTIDAVRPGDYRVMAQRTWNDSLRKPGTNDDAEQGERVTVRANQVASVKLVVESQTGTIKGTVIDMGGAPVADAFISAARESDAAGAQKKNVQQTRWSWDERPVLTSTDGSFTLTKLSPGAYTVRAYRKGGGEAVAEHVAIGATTKLQIKPTGLISGVVKAGAALDEVAITIRDLASGFSRREGFFRTDGRFSLPDLPAGKFQITASSDVGQAQLELTLAEGEQKTNVAIELAALVTIVGRVVEHGTNKPVSAIRMSARPAMGGGGFGWTSSGDERDFITDDAGKFTLKNAPKGKLTIRGNPKDWDESEWGSLSTVKDIAGTGTIDIGDLFIFKNRVKKNDPVGKLGLKFKEYDPETPPDKRKIEVSFIEPNGPAARTDIKVGDVLTSVDGVDVTGANIGQSNMILRAPPGTKVTIGLARGATVSITLAAP